MAEAKFFVQLTPEITASGYVRKLTADRVTQRRPSQPLPGSVTIELTVKIPDAAFLPLKPAAVIDIGAEHVLVNPVVEVVSEPIDQS